MSPQQVHGHEIPCNPMKGVSTKKHWHCPTCGIAVTTYVSLTEPPTHTCKKQLSKTIPLKETK